MTDIEKLKQARETLRELGITEVMSLGEWIKKFEPITYPESIPQSYRSIHAYQEITQLSPKLVLLGAEVDPDHFTDWGDYGGNKTFDEEAYNQALQDARGLIEGWEMKKEKRFGQGETFDNVIYENGEFQGFENNDQIEIHGQLIDSTEHLFILLSGSKFRI